MTWYMLNISDTIPSQDIAVTSVWYIENIPDMCWFGMVLVHCPRTNNVLAMYWVSTSPLAPSDFVCQCVHSLMHLANETHRLGPLWLLSQWTMECVIRYLGSLLRQPSNLFWNLTAQTKHVVHTNALVAMWLELEELKGNPQGSKDLGDNYLLLGPKHTTPYNLQPTEWTSLEDFFSRLLDTEDINQWTVY